MTDKRSLGGKSSIMVQLQAILARVGSYCTWICGRAGEASDTVNATCGCGLSPIFISIQKEGAETKGGEETAEEAKRSCSDQRETKKRRRRETQGLEEAEILLEGPLLPVEWARGYSKVP